MMNNVKSSTTRVNFAGSSHLFKKIFKKHLTYTKKESILRIVEVS